jgi:solute carrier family 6 GABA transporter-like protein 6/8/11/12/13
MVFSNGGGAFLIPYGIFAIFLGFPMMFLEVSLGQFTRQGTINAWKLSPVCKGIGFGSAMLALYSSLYYITVMAWAINYMFSCFTLEAKLPWMHCNNWFNTPNCKTYEDVANLTASSNSTNGTSNLFAGDDNPLSVNEYWKYYNLRMNGGGLEELGGLNNVPLILSLLAAWTIVYITIFKGTKSSGVMAYFTAIFPYIVIGILLIKGLTLEGAGKGVEFYLKPNMTKLLEPKVWMDAGSQVCFSYVICFVCLITVSSYNDFNKDTFKHAAQVSIACSVTSFIAGFAVFAVLGNMAHVLGTEVKDVVSSGPGLTFLAYPTALSLMPCPQIWNFMSFLMLVSLGISCEWTTVEAMLTVFFDHAPRFRKHRELVSLVLCGSLFIIGLIFTTPGGVYVFELFNSFAVGGVPLLWLTTFEAVAIGWVYGWPKFSENVKEMIGYHPSRFMEFCFRFITPTLTMSVFVFSCANFRGLVVQGYTFPDWANAIGYMLAFSSVICVPNYAIYQISLHDGSLFEKIRKARESKLHRSKLAYIKTDSSADQEKFIPLETYEESEIAYKKGKK